MTDIVIRDPLLIEILSDENFDGFTITELRDSYIEKSDKQFPKKMIRDKVYRIVYKLYKKAKWLDKIEANNLREAKYKKNNSFPREIYPNTSIDINLDKALNNRAVSSLKEKYQQHQIDLDASLAELEEYNELVMQFPELKKDIRNVYLNTRENSSKLLGKVNALKNVLERFKEGKH